MFNTDFYKNIKKLPILDKNKLIIFSILLIFHRKRPDYGISDFDEISELKEYLNRINKNIMSNDEEKRLLFIRDNIIKTSISIDYFLQRRSHINQDYFPCEKSSRPEHGISEVPLTPERKKPPTRLKGPELHNQLVQQREYKTVILSSTSLFEKIAQYFSENFLKNPRILNSCDLYKQAMCLVLTFFIREEVLFISNVLSKLKMFGLEDTPINSKECNLINYAIPALGTCAVLYYDAFNPDVYLLKTLIDTYGRKVLFLRNCQNGKDYFDILCTPYFNDNSPITKYPPIKEGAEELKRNLPFGTDVIIDRKKFSLISLLGNLESLDEYMHPLIKLPCNQNKLYIPKKYHNFHLHRILLPGDGGLSMLSLTYYAVIHAALMESELLNVILLRFELLLDLNKKILYHEKNKPYFIHDNKARIPCLYNNQNTNEYFSINDHLDFANSFIDAPIIQRIRNLLITHGFTKETSFEHKRERTALIQYEQIQKNYYQIPENPYLDLFPYEQQTCSITVFNQNDPYYIAPDHTVSRNQPIRLSKNSPM